MPLNTFVSGNPASMDNLARALRTLGASVAEIGGVWQNTQARSEREWSGPESEAFRNLAARTGGDARSLRCLYDDLARVCTTWSDEIETVKHQMERAKRVARDADLTINAGAIFPPGAVAAEVPPWRQRAAFAEAKTIIEQARRTERSAHERLVAALAANTTELDRLGQRDAWDRAAETNGATDTSDVAAPLRRFVTTLESRVSHGASGMVEQADLHGPHAVRGLWATLTTDQRADLITRYPHLVGRTNGVPIADRDIANRRLLVTRKTALLAPDAEPVAGLDGLRRCEQRLIPGETFLLSIDLPADQRGQLIVSSGNPERAERVLTTVLASMPSLDDVADHLDRHDAIRARAAELAPGLGTAAILWTAPSDVEGATLALSEFQEGLRATRDGDTRSWTTLAGRGPGTALVRSTVTSYDIDATELSLERPAGPTSVDDLARALLGHDEEVT